MAVAVPPPTGIVDPPPVALDDSPAVAGIGDGARMAVWSTGVIPGCGTSVASPGFTTGICIGAINGLRCCAERDNPGVGGMTGV